MRWARKRLGEELARGTEPGTSPELMVRAAQLRSRSERFRLANALVEAVGDEAPRSPRMSRHRR